MELNRETALEKEPSPAKICVSKSAASSEHIVTSQLVKDMLAWTHRTCILFNKIWNSLIARFGFNDCKSIGNGLLQTNLLAIQPKQIKTRSSRQKH